MCLIRALKMRVKFQLMASTKLSKHPLQIAVQRLPLTNEYVLVVDIKDNLKLTKFLVVFYRPVAIIYSRGGGGDGV